MLQNSRLYIYKIYNYVKYKSYTLTQSGDLTKFPNQSSVQSWAEAAMKWANGVGLISGSDQTDGQVLLEPQGTATRVQAASIIMNFDKNVVK